MDRKIKLEFYRNEGICHGCLSFDRDIAPLGELADLFYTLLKLPVSNVLLCWECRSILKKTLRFQHRFLQAQPLLQEATLQLNSLGPATLSTLGAYFNSNYESVQGNEAEEYIKESELKIEPDIFHKTRTGYIKEECDETLNGSDYEDLIEGIGEENIENGTHKEIEPNDVSLKKNVKGLLKIDRRRKKYINHAITTKNEANYIADNSVKCILSDEMIERLFNRRSTVIKKKKVHSKCASCNMEFVNDVDLKRHNFLKHLPPEGPYKCCECDNSCDYATLSDLRTHWTSHAMFKCKYCNEPYKSEGEVEVHLSMVHCLLYNCKTCDGTFSSYDDFFQHYEALHTKLVCDYCGKVFTVKNKLIIHLRLAHLPAVCTTCKRSYKTAHGLDAHCRFRHPEFYYDLTKKELSYCVECNKQFTSVFTYKKHLNTAQVHKPKKPSRIPCPECGKIFSRTTYMNNHYKLFHAKKSKHHCAICNKYYANAYGLRSHNQRIHEKTLPPKNKFCDICGRGFSTNRVLINHIRTHTGERPFKCSQCSAAFAQKYSRKMHERTQHKIF